MHIDPDIAALGREGGGGFSYTVFESISRYWSRCDKAFFRLSFGLQGKGGLDGRQLFIT